MMVIDHHVIRHDVSSFKQVEEYKLVSGLVLLSNDLVEAPPDGLLICGIENGIAPEEIAVFYQTQVSMNLLVLQLVVFVVIAFLGYDRALGKLKKRAVP